MLRIGLATILSVTLCLAILGIFTSTAGKAPLTLPTGLSPVVGGIADQRPYFGKFKAAPDNFEATSFSPLADAVRRVLMSTADGKQWEFPVRFYSAGDHQPTGDVAVFGQSDKGALLGTVRLLYHRPAELPELSLSNHQELKPPSLAQKCLLLPRTR